MIWKVGEGDAYTLLSALLADEVGLEPTREIRRTETGKPYFPDRPDLHFSLSHSGGVSLCALADTPVGADVELVRPRSLKLPRYALSHREYEWYESRGGRWEDFYTLWTLKEARVKCTGEGIFHSPVRAVEVPLLEPGEQLTWEGFRFASLAGEGWRGALCRENRSKL